MGIPVTGKNLFPSNIAGLPTWFTIRVDRDGYSACVRENEVVIAMNEATIDEDLAALKPGTIAIVNDKLPIRKKREDLTLVPCPFTELAGKITTDPSLRSSSPTWCMWVLPPTCWALSRARSSRPSPSSSPRRPKRSN